MAALCVFLTAACGYDYKDKRIPNNLVLAMAFLGIGWRLLDGELQGMIFYLAQTAAVMVLFYPLFKIGSVGAGDVKLLGVTAGYLPFGKVLVFLFCSLLAAAVISVFKMWRGHIFRERIRYLCRYLQEGMTAGKWKLYLEAETDKRRVGICLSGPVLISVLMYLGGVY